MKKSKLKFAGIVLITLCPIFTSCSDLDGEFAPLLDEEQELSVTDQRSDCTDPEDPEDPGNTNTGC